MALCSCVGSRGVLVPSSTLAPTILPTLEATFEPTPLITAPVIDRSTDLLGNAVQGANHFEQFISFSNIQVYEQCNDTFVDMKIENSYPAPLKIALKITFFDENDLEAANAMFQSQNGQYAMILPSGASSVYAQVNTDMTITDLDFRIDFDSSFAVMPENW